MRTPDDLELNGQEMLPTLDDSMMEEINQQFPIPFSGDDFYGNLVPFLKRAGGDYYLTKIANELIEKVEQDIASLKDWEKSGEKGIELLGYTIEDLPNDSRNVPDLKNSAYAQAIQSTVIHISDEILKPDGCAAVVPKPKDAGDELYAAAEFVQESMNDYLLSKDRGFYPDMSQALMWCVTMGNVFRKVYIDAETKLPMSRYIYKIIINNNFKSIEDARRITEIETFTRNQIIARNMSKFFVNEDIKPSESNNEENPIDDSLNKIKGITPESAPINQDTYEIYIISTFLPLEVTPEGFEEYNENYELNKLEYPYKLWVDVTSRKILRLERNWDPRISKLKYRDKYYHYTFFRGFDFMGLGLAHMCGNNAQILNFIGKQLLDSALRANHSSFLMNKGLRNKESTLQVTPGTITTVDTLGDIANSLMPVPTKEPSSMLYQMGNDIVSSTQQMGASLNQSMEDYNPNMPVGTMVAMIQQQLKMPNYIVKNIHTVFSNELTDLGALLVETGCIQIDYGVFEQLKITSVANPHLSSNIQRSLVAEMLYKTSEAMPDMFNRREVVKFYLSSNMIMDVDKYLNPEPPPPPEPIPLDPLTENINMGKGLPVIAHVMQDHDSHNIVHEDELATELTKPDANPMKIQAIRDHITHHNYLKAIVSLMIHFQQEIPDDPMIIAQNIELQNMIAQAEAQEIINKAQQQQQQPPIDPTAAIVEDIKVKEANAQLKAQTDRMKAELDYKKAQERNEVDILKMQTGAQLAREKLEVETAVAKEKTFAQLSTEEWKAKLNSLMQIMRK